MKFVLKKRNKMKQQKKKRRSGQKKKRKKKRKQDFFSFFFFFIFFDKNNHFGRVPNDLMAFFRSSSLDWERSGLDKTKADALTEKSSFSNAAFLVFTLRKKERKKPLNH